MISLILSFLPISGTILPIRGLFSMCFVTSIILSRVNYAYLAESFEMYSAIDFKSVRDLRVQIILTMF